MADYGSYSAWLEFKNNWMVMGAQEYDIDYNTISRCIFSAAKWVDEETRVDCNSATLLFPLDKNHLQSMINTRQVVECSIPASLGKSCYNIELPPTPIELPDTFSVRLRNFNSIDDDIRLAYNNGKLVDKEMVYDKSNEAKIEGFSFSKKSIQTMIDKGELLPCGSYIVATLPYDEKLNTSCYMDLEEFNTVDLSNSFTIRLVGEYGSSGADRDFSAELRYENSILVSGWKKYIVSSGSGQGYTLNCYFEGCNKEGKNKLTISSKEGEIERYFCLPHARETIHIQHLAQGEVNKHKKFLYQITHPPKDWRFYAKWIGLGLIMASLIYWLYF